MLNKVMLIGTKGKVFINPNVIKFSLATSYPKKKDPNNPTGKTEYVTMWHNIIVFNEQLGIFVRDFVNQPKSMKLYVEGKISTGEYQNKEGVTVKTFDIIANDIKILSSKDKVSYDANNAGGSVLPVDDNANDFGDVPF